MLVLEMFVSIYIKYYLKRLYLDTYTYRENYAYSKYELE